MQGWHERHGAVFEDVGQWRRPWYYPRPGEDMHAAVAREVAAARSKVAILDASTLGKIDLQGRDAAELLNRVYTNAWSKLAIGRCRYGLMLGDDGMVFDDGVTTRLGEQHYLMSTTSGGAARVLAWLEEWLQTEWPELQVYCASVTEQWATISLSGPDCRKLVAELVDDVDLDPERFPHMSVREGHVRGVPARIFRISFTGELGYELQVPASYGLPLWEACIEAGAKYGITPYGTEAMHVLRAEKGYIIAGQETDGTVDARGSRHGVGGRQAEAGLHRQTLARPRRHAGARAQAAGRPLAGRSRDGARRGRAARGRPRRGGADDDDRPRDLELRQPQSRPQLRARDGPRRPGPDRPEALCAAERPDARGRRSPAPCSSTRKAAVCMPERILRQSRARAGAAAARAASGSASARASARSSCAAIRANAAFMTGVGRVLDLLLPTEPNGSASKNAITALWLGPDQWLLTCPADDAAFFINSLREALADVHAAVTDQSDGRVAFALAGPSARDVLAKGCPLDLHPQSFTPGSAAQTLLAKADVLLHLRADDPHAGPTFDLYVARSFATYLWSWLADAGLEYGVQIEPAA